MQYFFKRLREPSTWLGLAALIAGGGQLAKINEASAVADAVAGAGQAVASGADPLTAGALAVGGLVAAIMRERGDG